MAAKKIDINKATIEDFETLAGIGHAKAEAILEARQVCGGFRSVADLLEISGIGPSLLEQNRGLLVCGRLSTSRKVDTRSRSGDKLRPMETSAASPSCTITPPISEKSHHDKALPGPSNPRTTHAHQPKPENTPVTRNKSSCSSADADHRRPSSGRSNRRSLRSDLLKDMVPDTSHDGESESECTDQTTFSSADTLPSLSAPNSISSHEIHIDSNEGDLTTPHASSDEHDDSDDPHTSELLSDQAQSPASAEKPWMKRKSDGEGSTEIFSGKKPCRLRAKLSDSEYPEYDSAASLRSCLAALSASNNASNIRKQRIPSKSNPPPQLANWLKTFQEWSHAERLLALDEMIEFCEPTQVRHLMAVIEPQFQRDFISLLPKELALYVLSFLDPRDLLRAAQTCRYWRVLAEDNLLWREKCREESIDEATVFENRMRQRKADAISPNAKSPWKNLYLRQKAIEHNWRASTIRSPKVLKGHDDHVITCLEFSGTKVVSGSDDNTLKVWSAVTGKCLRTLVGHTGGVWSSQMAGNIIISGSTDRTLKVWNADTGQCTYTLYGHTSTVRCMHLNGDKVVSGSRDATLRVWNVETGQCLHVLMGHMAAVRCVQYDGKRVVSGAYDYTVRVWDPDTETCIHILNGHTNRVYSLQFDGVHIVSGSLDTSIRVWDVESGNCLHTLIGHQSLTSGMELKDNILVSGNADSTVKVWDITTGQCLQTLQGTNKHQSAVTCLQFNKKFVITSSDDGSVKIWDLKAGDFLRNLVALDSGGSGGVVWRIRCSNTKLVCAVGSRNGTEETKLLVLDFDVEDPDSNASSKTSHTSLRELIENENFS